MFLKGLILLLLGISMPHIFAEEPAPDEKTSQALKNILKIEIDVILLGKNKAVAWNSKGEKYTIPGRPVTIKIEGNNIKMTGSFTPYYDPAGNLILLAQGQIFILSPSGKEFKYFSYFKSIRASPGEMLVFFPLGYTEDTATGGETANIEIDIMIVPYGTQGGTGVYTGDK